jgi:hypothetical protein
LKTDRRDAERLARLLRLGELVAVRVPDPLEEAARDLVRAREDARGDLMRARHRLSKLLLRHGLVYPGSAWTLAHDAWLRRQRFQSRPLSLAFDECYGAVLQAKGRRDSLDGAIAELAGEQPSNTHARRLLVEAAWHQRRPLRASAALERRRQGQPAAVRARADASARRVHTHWYALESRRKRRTIVAVAVARELAGHCWALATMR